MKSPLFVALSSFFLVTWLVISFVTTLQPEPRLGRGSLPLSAKVSPVVSPVAELAEENSTLLAKQKGTEAVN